MNLKSPVASRIRETNRRKGFANLLAENRQLSGLSSSRDRQTQGNVIEKVEKKWFPIWRPPVAGTDL